MKVGDKAPDFCLPNRYAQKICLKDFFGKWVILYFYVKNLDPKCTQEAVQFSSLLPKFEELNTVVIGVSPDTVRSHYDFAIKNKLQIILLSDKNKDAIKNYGVWRERPLSGPIPSSVVRSTFLINPGGNIVHLWENVRIESHAIEVLNTLKAIRKKK